MLLKTLKGITFKVQAREGQGKDYPFGSAKSEHILETKTLREEQIWMLKDHLT